MAFSYKATADERLKKSADAIIEALALAQGDDGYLGVFTGGGRFSDRTIQLGPLESLSLYNRTA